MRPRALAWLLLLAPSACQYPVHQFAPTFRNQGYDARLSDELVGVLRDREPATDGTIGQNYLWYMPVVYATEETLYRDDVNTDTEAVRAERWDSVLLGLLYQRMDRAIWATNGELQNNLGSEQTLLGAFHRRTWSDVLSYDAKRRRTVTFDLVFGMVSFDRNETHVTHLRLFGLEVF